MTIQQFIEKAIEGGWKDLHSFQHYNGYWARVSLKETTVIENAETGEEETVQVAQAFKLEEILLDPEAWKAVGKVEGWHGYCYACDEIWDDGEHYCGPDGVVGIGMDGHIYRMHGLIDHLAEGGTIESYLAGL